MFGSLDAYGSDTVATAFVLLGALIHAIRNALLKSGQDKLFIQGVNSLMRCLLMVPVTFLVPLPTTDLWIILAASLAAHLLFQALIVNAYRFGDLSVVYPIARGTAPVMTAGAAAIVFAEYLPPLGIVGVLMIAGALATFAVGGRALMAVQDRRGILLALATAASISTFTIIDAAGARMAENVFTFMSWLFVLDGGIFAIGSFAWRGMSASDTGGLRDSIARDWWRGVLMGIMSLGSFGFVILALRYGNTAEIAALRETSVVFAAIIGTLFLGEPLGRRRVIAAAVVAAGIILLRVS